MISNRPTATNIMQFVAAIGFLLISACASDDPLSISRPEPSLLPATITTTEAAEPAPVIDTTPEPITIPDDALDFTGQPAVTIDVKDNAFVQRIVVISEGTTVTWTNNGIQPHNVTPSVEGSFEIIPTGDLEPDVSVARTFPASGDYPYFCSLHGTARFGQRGQIIVVADT